MERNIAVAGEVLKISLDERTELRGVAHEDADELFAAIGRNCDRLSRWLFWSSLTYSMDDVRQFLSQNVTGNIERSSLAMIIRRDGAICGAISLHKIDQRNKCSSIGYWIDSTLEGQGLVTAACRAIVSAGFRDYHLHRIEIRCATWNHRSSAIPRRLGFLEEGILREAEYISNKWVDLRVFSMLAQDWNPAGV